MRSIYAALFLLILSGCADEETQITTNEVEASTDLACVAATFEEARLTLCTADPEQHRIHTALGPAEGKPYRDLASYAAHRPSNVEPVVFAVNGGMFDDDGKPIGYYVQDGERLKTLNRARGPGNFHMLPNGVFYGSQGKWEIRTSEDFYDKVTTRPDFGTQSGPMLVIAGELHPEIAPDGESLRIRNAVGVDSAGRALFVISEEPLSFGKLARFYRDVLKVSDALYLDGTVSSLWAPASDRLDASYPIGPLIVVEKRAKPATQQEN